VGRVGLETYELPPIPLTIANACLLLLLLFSLQEQDVINRNSVSDGFSGEHLGGSGGGGGGGGDVREMERDDNNEDNSGGGGDDSPTERTWRKVRKD